MITLILPVLTVFFFSIWKKEIALSLTVGIITATLMYAKYNSLGYLYKKITIFLSSTEDLKLLCFLVIFAILIEFINQAQLLYAYQTWIKKKIISRQSLKKVTLVVLALLFIDDFFASFTTKALIAPLAPAFGISKTFLAFLIDSNISSWCALIPFSSWGVMLVNQIKQSITLTSISPFQLLLYATPFSFYPIITIIRSWLANPNNWGEKLDKRSSIEKKNYSNEKNNEIKRTSFYLSIAPFGLFLITILLNFIYTLYSNPHFSFTENLGHFDLVGTMLISSLVAIITAFIIIVSKKILTVGSLGQAALQGIKDIKNSIFMLAAISIFSSIIKDIAMQQATAINYIQYLPISIAPVLFFLFSFGLALGIGSVWASMAFSIQALSIIDQTALHLPLMIGAIISGSIAGAQATPIGNPIIISSLGADCQPFEHYNTQIKYVIQSTLITIIIYLGIGFFY